MPKPSATAAPAGRLQLLRKLQLMAAGQLPELHQLARVRPAQPAARALLRAMRLATEAAQLMYPSLYSPLMVTI